ncbi:MAG: ankyrin repeat domain-containing protein, partial [bacterium]
ALSFTKAAKAPALAEESDDGSTSGSETGVTLSSEGSRSDLASVASGSGTPCCPLPQHDEKFENSLCAWTRLERSITGVTSRDFFIHYTLRLYQEHILATSLTTTGSEPGRGEGSVDTLTVADLQAFVESFMLPWPCSQAAVLAAHAGNLPMLRFALERSNLDFIEPLNMGTQCGITALMSAARLGHKGTVAYILDTVGATEEFINFKSTPNGCFALSDAAMRGHVSVVELLLNWKARINLARGDGKTALHCAALHGHASCVRLLLSRGADPNCQDCFQRTPEQLAPKWRTRVHQVFADVFKRKDAGAEKAPVSSAGYLGGGAGEPSIDAPPANAPFIHISADTTSRNFRVPSSCGILTPSHIRKNVSLNSLSLFGHDDACSIPSDSKALGRASSYSSLDFLGGQFSADPDSDSEFDDGFTSGPSF